MEYTALFGSKCEADGCPGVSPGDTVTYVKHRLVHVVCPIYSPENLADLSADAQRL